MISPGRATASEELECSLLRRVVARDSQALEQLYMLYHRRLARFLGRFIRDYALVEEIVNDTLFVVWQQAAHFRGQSRVSTWIMGIAWRRAHKALRAVPALATAGEVAELAGRDDIAETEMRELFARALSTLPLEQRAVLELTYYAGHSCEEIAAIVDCPVNTVKTRMFHARRKLRELLPALGVGEMP